MPGTFFVARIDYIANTSNAIILLASFQYKAELLKGLGLLLYGFGLLCDNASLLLDDASLLLQYLCCIHDYHSNFGSSAMSSSAVGMSRSPASTFANVS